MRRKTSGAPLARLTAMLGLCAVLLMIGTALGGPDIQSKIITLNLDRNALKIVKHNGRDLLLLKLPRCEYPADPVGAPLIPARFVHILVPRGAKFEGVTITDCKTDKLLGTFEPDFVRAACRPGEQPPASGPDQKIFGGANPFPAKRVEFLRAGMLRGHKIFFLRVNPLQYLPKTGELLFHSQIKLNIEYRVQREPESTVRPRRMHKLFKRMLARNVDNAADIDSIENAGQKGAGAQPPAPGGQIDYLIICSETYKDAFQPLADWKKQKGVPATIVTTEDITANPDYNKPGDPAHGNDLQIQIKRCIIDYVNNNGTIYVLLGGDTDTVPDRDCYGKVGGTTDTGIPCDLYYAGLDDLNWNDDGDGGCGDTNGDSIDMEPDVFVGRLCCREVEHAQGYASKVIEYEKEVPSTGFCKEVLLSGVMCWTGIGGKSDSHTWSLRMYDDCIAPYWSPNMTEFFDSTPGLTLTSTELRDKIDEGFGFMNMATHGYMTNWSMESGGSYSTSVADSQTNSKKYCIVYTIACLTNYFDHTYRCLGEALTRLSDGGAIAYMGCARYGWGSPGSYSGGPSFLYNRTFYKKLFGEGLYHLGEAYTEHKWHNADLCGQYGTYRWLQFGINLLGDPELPVWTEDPQTMSVIYPAEIAPGNQTIYIKAEPGSHICLWKVVSSVDEVYVHGDADQDGIYSAIINPTVGTLKLTVTKHNYYPVEADITVTTSPSLYIETLVLPDGQTGLSYSATLTARGGTPGYTWTQAGGSLPGGLTINADGTITGTPTTPGSSTFTAQVEDAALNTATREFTIEVSLDVPQLLDIPSPDADGDYTVNWTSSDTPTHYELQESSSFADKITDNAESGSGQWDVSGFSISSSRSHSPSQSFYGGYNNEEDYTLTYADPIIVGNNTQVSFWRWYDIEEDFDYAYFEILPSDGVTWRALKLYTGTATAWAQETIDLSAYAGTSVQMRFRYSTDQLVLEEGFYVDDIEITDLSIYDWVTLSNSIATKHYDITGRAPGTYYYRARAFDATNTSDWSEVKWVTVSSGPLDLYDNGTHTVSPTTVEEGQMFSIGLDVGCSGTGYAGPHKTTFYFSADNSITAGDYPVGEFSSPGFGVGYETQSVSIPFPATVPGGTYYIGCIIDSIDQVAETDEVNNAVLFVEQVAVTDVPGYTLTVNITGSGTVIKSPDKTKYTPGENVQLAATPDTGWLFDHWEGDLTGSTNPANITMDDDKTVTAVFVGTEYTLNAKVTGNGTVSKNPDKATYTPGENVELTATPDTGWIFHYWEGDLTGIDNPATITMDNNKTVTAVFIEEGSIQLVVNVTGNGTVTKEPDKPGYNPTDEVTLTATPDADWTFDSWEGDLTGTVNPATIIMDNNKTVIAVFVEIEYTLDVSITGGGTVTRNPDKAAYTPGEPVQLTAVPDVGWFFFGWEGDLTGSISPANITMDGNKTVTAIFVEVGSNLLAVNVAGNGTVTKEPDKYGYDPGDEVILTATPDAGWFFHGWEGDLTGKANPASVIMDGNKTVTAVFATIYIAPDDGGGCSCSLNNAGHTAPNPGSVAGYFLPFLLLMLCIASLRKHRAGNSPRIRQRKHRGEKVPCVPRIAQL